MKGSSFLSYSAAAIMITIICGLIYATVQQSYRTAANDPQLQMAKDITFVLNKGRSLESLLPKDSIEISENVAPFITLYDRNGNPIRSSGFLFGKMPVPPKGVFDFTEKNGEDILSWQPAAGVRMALVMESVYSGDVAFVAAGHSLMETEKRQSNLVKLVMIGWFLCLAVIVGHWVFSVRAIR
jgi:hypothetical protein